MPSTQFAELKSGGSWVIRAVGENIYLGVRDEGDHHSSIVLTDEEAGQVVDALHRLTRGDRR